MKASFNNIFTYLLERLIYLKVNYLFVTYLLERLIYLKVNYLFVEYQDVRKRRK